MKPVKVFNPNLNPNLNHHHNDLYNVNMTSNSARNFRDYKVWQDAVDYATLVYEVTGKIGITRKTVC